MPRYPYTCSKCGSFQDVFKPMAQYRDPEFCKCGAQMERDFGTGHSCASLDDAFHKPIEMFSVAPETPAQMRKLREQCPDIKFTPDRVPIAHSRAEKLRILKVCGFEEH